MRTKDSEVVIGRLKEVFSVTSDSALCEQISVSPQTLSSWKSRNKIPYANCVEISIQKGISLDWLLTGRGQMIIDTPEKASAPEISFSNSDLTLLELINQLDPEVRKDLMRSAEEKQRMIELERKVNELSSELEKNKRAG